MKRVQAGQLRSVVDIEETRETRNSYNEPEVEWIPFKSNVYASIEPLGGRELWQAQQVQADVSHRVRVRWVDGLNTKMRFKYGSRYFNIEHVGNTEEHDIIQVCLCREQA